MVRSKKIDLREADSYVATEVDLIIEQLVADGVYNKNLRYRGFDGRKINIMLKHGTDSPESDKIFSGEEGDLRGDDDTAIIHHIFKHSKPALAVYDGSKLRGNDFFHRSEFIEPDKKLEALVAVYTFRQ